MILPQSKHQKTLIFDLDETLVHCIDDIDNVPYDFPIRVTFPTGETIEAGINVRPFSYECLKEASKNYQIVVFTASHRSYADVVLDTLENEFRKLSYVTDEEKLLPRDTLKKIKKNQKLFSDRLYR